MSSASQHQLAIWHIPTVIDDAVVQRLYTLLSTAEQHRADRAHSEQQKNTYITSHAAMRLILAEKLQLAPSSITYINNKHGKPRLDNDKQLFFNLSHTDNYALLALSPTSRLGVDIETVKPARNVLAIARRFFSDDEYTWLSRTEPAQQHAFFYQLWCHKEACLKAGGLGLQAGLSSFSFSAKDLQQETVITDSLLKQWWVKVIDVPQRYRAAIAMDQANIITATHHWQYRDDIESVSQS